MTPPKLIIGLGNPGKEYEHTYHNAGFLFVDHILSKDPSTLPIKGNCIIKSGVFMNTSGSFVNAQLSRYSCSPSELLIVHDDSDLPIGSYQFGFGKGSAGHRGVLSVIEAIGTENFWRLRIGIRPPQKEGTPRVKAEEFVLKPIRKAHADLLAKVCEQAYEELTARATSS